MNDDEIGRSFLEQVFQGRYDFGSEHMDETPVRFVKMLRQLTQREPYNFTTFSSTSDEMIVVKDITWSSLCAHHIVPFMGVAHIGYVPRNRICGLSKLARCVRWHAHDLTVQEDLTAAIADTINDKLDPLGVAVVLEAEHLCMSIRGVQVPGAKTITSNMSGCFAEHSKQARSEFLRLIGHQ